MLKPINWLVNWQYIAGVIVRSITYARNTILRTCRARSEPGSKRWRMGGEVKGKLANGVGSQYSHATSESGISSITKADVYTSAASSRLKWRPHRFEWTRPFRGKTKSGFCAFAIRFRTSYTMLQCRPRRGGEKLIKITGTHPSGRGLGARLSCLSR